jgi:hypothetical protein
VSEETKAPLTTAAQTLTVICELQEKMGGNVDEDASLCFEQLDALNRFAATKLASVERERDELSEKCRAAQNETTRLRLELAETKGRLEELRVVTVATIEVLHQSGIESQVLPHMVPGVVRAIVVELSQARERIAELETKCHQ